jgi:2,3-bisphosphoglycerate-independent phosphoglycerate mutase
MKFVIVVGDGMADERIESLGGRTPLQCAHTPNFDRIVQNGSLGSVITIPQDMPLGSDVANLTIMGYDPHVYYTGRGPLEAANIGVKLSGEDVAFRCNLVTLEGKVLRDYSAGRITTPEADKLIKSLSETLKGTRYKGIISFYTGTQYRHLMVWKGGKEKVKTTPPHDIMGEPFEDYLPRGEGAETLNDLIRWSWMVLKDHPINIRRIAEGKYPANSIWMWGQGKPPAMPKIPEKYGLTGAVISAVDLIKGIGIYAGLDVIDVPGATGYLDTDYRAKAEYALDALHEKDFVFIHVEAPDEASHEGDVELKIRAIQDVDGKVVGTLLKGLEGFDEYRVMIITDHFTPISLKTHTHGAVPFAVCGSGVEHNGFKGFCEEEAARSDLRFERGWELMDWFLSNQR